MLRRRRAGVVGVSGFDVHLLRDPQPLRRPDQGVPDLELRQFLHHRGAGVGDAGGKLAVGIGDAGQAKVQDLEYKIDELVYKLYGLTDEEIKIVEAK